MKKEKIVLSFIAALIGLLVASVAFYFYQGTKTSPSGKGKTITLMSPTPSQTVHGASSVILTVDSPQDESVVNKKTLTVSGKTLGNATVLVLTPTDEQVLTPASNGDFSTTVTIDSDQNSIEITAIAPNGEENSITKTVTYSTETF